MEVVDPKVLLGSSRTGDEENIILFEPSPDGERGYAWLVDTVEQVLSISNDEIDESVADDEIRAIIERDDELIMWVTDDCFAGTDGAVPDEEVELDPTDGGEAAES